jgi:C-terminal processing protease CtpA/Prc
MRKRNTQILIFDLRGNGGGNSGLGTRVVNKVINRKYDADYKPHRNAYPCKLVLLCDRGTASAASWVATCVKDYGIGIIAGEETGGRACICGNIKHISLPNSGLRCGIATRFIMRPAGYDDRKGVLPDLPLDVRANDDTIVEKIARYLSSSENKREQDSIRM